ncbi:MAG: tetratricopeptide repeat protein, partial [Desulfobacteraceae bacterium]
VQRGLTADNIVWAFTDATGITNFWAPLTWLSIIIDYELYGMNAGGYHVTNLIIHIANSLLVLLVFYKMTGALWKSLFMAAMFALHPQHVESVAWITERKDVLSAFFWLLTMLSYAFYIKNPRIHLYIVTILCFVMGLMSKPMLVTLPFVLLLLDYWPLKRIQISNLSETTLIIYRHFIEKLPFFFLIIIISVAAFITQDKGDALPSITRISPLLRIENVAISYIKYLWKTICPFDLYVPYLFPRSIPLWSVIGSLIVIASVSIFAVKNVKRFPWFIIGWLWYLGTMVPVIGFVVIADQAMADRYTYIPHIGIFIIFAWSIPALLVQLPNRKAFLIIAATCSITMQSVIAANQVRYWKDSRSLFEHTTNIADSNYLAYNNLGLAYQRDGEIQKAIQSFQRSVQLNPMYFSAYNNLGVVEESIGNAQQAINLYKIAIRLKPEFKEPYINLAFILLHTGEIGQSIEYGEKAVLLDPTFTPAYIILGDAYKKSGYLQKSIQMYQKALQLDNRSDQAHSRIGDAYLKGHRIEDALFHFRTAVRINPSDMNYQRNLMKVIAVQAEIDKQITLTALELKQHPFSPDMHNKLGLLFKQKGKTEKAIIQFKKALSIRPDFTPALFNLVKTYIDNDNRTEIEPYLQKILDSHPGDSDYSYNIACLYAKLNDKMEAVKWLSRSIDDGYNNQVLMQTDTDLENIRGTDEFNDILKKMYLK